MEDYISYQEERKLSPGRVNGIRKHVQLLYNVNRIPVKLPYALSRRVVCKDRAPTPQETSKILDASPLRTKLAISMMVQGGFREETLSKLCYIHVREDLDAGRIPLHVHLPAQILKGAYADADTFLGPETVELLKLYFNSRRLGSPDGKIPPGTIDDNSPLIRDSRSPIPRPVGPKQIRKMIHHAFQIAGLLGKKTGRMYSLRVHGLRKSLRQEWKQLA